MQQYRSSLINDNASVQDSPKELRTTDMELTNLREGELNQRSIRQHPNLHDTWQNNCDGCAQRQWTHLMATLTRPAAPEPRILRQRQAGILVLQEKDYGHVEEISSFISSNHLLLVQKIYRKIIH
jgi:hypothetical protein